jgi:uncharacterized sulfatase
MQTCPDPMDWALEHNREFDTSSYHTNMLTALRTSEFKFQKSEGRTDLLRLPDETTDVSEEYPETAAELEQELDAWMDEYGEPFGPAREGELSDAMREQLSDLGYVLE